MEITEAYLDKRFATLATKEYLDEQIKDLATKEDLERFATKEDLERFATKEDLRRFATKEDLNKEVSRLATREDLTNFAIYVEGRFEGVQQDISSLHIETTGIREELGEVKQMVFDLSRRDREDTDALTKDMIDVQKRVTVLESVAKRARAKR